MTTSEADFDGNFCSGKFRQHHEADSKPLRRSRVHGAGSEHHSEHNDDMVFHQLHQRRVQHHPDHPLRQQSCYPSSNIPSQHQHHPNLPQRTHHQPQHQPHNMDHPPSDGTSRNPPDYCLRYHSAYRQLEPDRNGNSVGQPDANNRDICFSDVHKRERDSTT